MAASKPTCFQYFAGIAGSDPALSTELYSQKTQRKIKDVY